MDEGTLEGDDLIKSNEKVDENVYDVSTEEDDLEFAIQCTTKIFSITKKELLKKNPNKGEEYVGYFRSTVNGSFGKSPSYQISLIVRFSQKLFEKLVVKSTSSEVL